VVDRLADVVEQGTGARDGDIRAELFGEHAGDVRRFNRMLEDALAVAGAEGEAPEERDQFRIKSDDTCLICRGVALLLHNLSDLNARLLNRFFYFHRLDAPVSDELLQGNCRHVPAQGVKLGNGNPIRHIINQHIHAGHALKRFNIATLLSDNLSLHFF